MNALSQWKSVFFLSYIIKHFICISFLEMFIHMKWDTAYQRRMLYFISEEWIYLNSRSIILYLRGVNSYETWYCISKMIVHMNHCTVASRSWFIWNHIWKSHMYLLYSRSVRLWMQFSEKFCWSLCRCCICKYFDKTNFVAEHILWFLLGLFFLSLNLRLFFDNLYSWFFFLFRFVTPQCLHR